ncbi:MAG: YbjQ family protein, partial [Phycisphaerae bacterium]|nr:YbjQ family protein [Phycisphaerae bacterium]
MKIIRQIVKIIRQFGSLAFVLGLFVTVFAGVPWGVLMADDPVVPWWLRIAVFCLLGGILIVLGTLAIERPFRKAPQELPEAGEARADVLLLNAPQVPGREITA